MVPSASPLPPSPWAAARSSLLAGLVALLTVTLAALVWWQAGRSQAQLRAQVMGQAEQRSLQLADAMAGQVAGLLSSIDLALQQMRREWRGNPEDFDATARAMLAALPPGAVTHVSVADAQGLIVYNSLGVQEATFVGDREHFKAQQGGGDRLVIGKPVFSRLGKTWTFIVNRPLRRAGAFAGTMNVSVSSDHISRKLAGLALSDKDVVALLHGDGSYMARSQDAVQAMGKTVPRERPLLAPGAAARGVFHMPGAFDQTARIYAWRRMDDYGLITAIGLAEDAVLAPLRAGQERDSLLRAALVTLAGLFGGLIAVLLLQVARKQRELAASEAFRRRVFESSPVPIVVMDGEARGFVDCNAAAVRLYGHGSREQTLATPPQAVSAAVQYDGTPSDEFIRRHVDAAARAGSAVFRWRHRRPDGVHWDAEVHLLGFDLGARRYLQLTLQDITERLHAEAALQQLNATLDAHVQERTRELEAALATLRQAQDELVRNEKMAALGSLVAGLAHELNTPIGNAVMVASTLSGRQGEFEATLAGGLRRSALQAYLANSREAAEVLERNLQRAAELIGSFKQIAVDQSSYQRRRFEVAEVVQEIAIALRPTLRRGGVTLVDETPPGLHMDSFPGPLGQVLINLVNNAVVHAFESGAGGSVRIGAEPLAGDRVHLWVADDGRGIPAQHLRQVFDPFFTTKLGQGGSGLGLHIAYTLVTGLLGGRISVQSAAGQGTRFRIELPCSAPAAAGAPLTTR
ncbi:MAG: ATP-binding protein [Rubrivivax sp.]|nr:ATP-binding protein [Rubrivivax sp.]